MIKRSFSQYPVLRIPDLPSQSLIREGSKNLSPLQETLQALESGLALISYTFPKLPRDIQNFKISSLMISVNSLKLHLRQLELAKQETISKYEGKIAFIEEELVDNERKNYALKDKVRVLTSQLGQMRDEYNQLSEDFNSTMQLLKEQMSSREKAMDDEEDKIYKLNSLIKSLTEELSAKEEELQSIKDHSEKFSKAKSESPEDPQQSLEKLEKKYKSLEVLYMQQVQKNNSLQEDLESRSKDLETKTKDLETKNKDLQEKLKDYESQLQSYKQSKDNSLADCSQGSLSETDQSSQKVSWRFEATQLQSKLNEYKFEISRLEKSNEDYKFEIILLHNKVAGLQAQLNKKPEINEIVEVSDLLKSKDYELTGTLEPNESLKMDQFVLETINEENYQELVKTVIVNNLVCTENLSDYEIIKKTIESLVAVRETLLKHFEIKREKPDLAKDLERFIKKRVTDLSAENKTVFHKPSKREEIDFNNYTEPSPRATARTINSPNFNPDLKSKLLSKKKIILLHKEQIICLKKQLREAESALKVYQNLDISLLKTLMKNLFEYLPKEDEKTEKEVEICMELLGFTHEDYLVLKQNRTKKSKFRFFG